ncbi:MAG: hypothetical protein MK085_06685 [Phycisphaerales bacterium]|nr:hypothetical protein [Phycisphaerales bacterium]
MMFRAFITAVGCLAASLSIQAADDVDRPWQYDDGTIVHLGHVFKNWSEYYASDLFDPSQKCATPEPLIDDEEDGPVQGFGGFNPSDCTTSSTTISGAYDPLAGIYRIPVVFHVIRDTNGNQGNLSEACVESQIRILNEDFNGIPGTNGEDGVESRIEFHLADVDPNGNPTNGITFSNNSTWYNDSGSYWNSLAWDTNRYLNIYSNTAGGALGYVPGFPQQGLPGQAQDRVVVLWTTVGDCATLDPYDLGRTVTHEVGHYLGLYHTFQGGCGSSACYNSGDLICDTAAEQSSTFGCPTGSSSCGSLDPIDNYMDYSDDPCMRRFTPEQANRMRCALVNYRPDLYEDGPLTVSFPDGLPSTVPSAGADVAVETATESGVRVDAVTLDYQFTESGSSGSMAGISKGGNNWIVTIPASPLCPDIVQFALRIDLDNGETVEEGPYSALVNDGYNIAAEWNGNSSDGWTLGLPSDTATDGQWGQGNPAGGGVRGDPADDGDGSGGCFLTDNVSGNSDVDGGITTLVSPVFDATGLEDPLVSYLRWYSNDFGADPNNDVMPIEISNNGGSSWTLLENVTENAGAWVYREFLIDEFVTPTNTMQLRFIAGDLNAGSVVEAGIDNLRIGSIFCKNDPVPCPGDLDGSGEVDGGDIGLLLVQFGNPGSADFDGNGVVDGGDLGLLLVYWGPCSG